MIEHLVANQQITTVFQPIVDLADGRVIGYEGLSRGPAGSALESPRLLFAAAERAGLGRALENACWGRALHSAAAHRQRRGASAKLFLNVLPDQVDLRFLDEIVIVLRGVGLDPTQVVVELTEGMRIDDYARLCDVLEHYRAAGFGIAIDDAGAGHSGLQTIAELNPDYLKIDRSLINDIDRHIPKRATVEALLLLARSLAITVIAEGIEREQELAELQRLRVPCGQGYLLAYPADVPPPISPAAARIFANASPRACDWRPRRSGARDCEQSIGSLVAPPITSPADADLRAVMATLERRRAGCIVVVDHAEPIGLLMKARAYQLLSERHGRDIHLRQSIELVARPNPLIVRHDDSLESVSRLAMARTEDALYDDIIVMRNATLLGTVSVRRLLDAITDARAAESSAAARSA